MEICRTNWRIWKCAEERGEKLGGKRKKMVQSTLLSQARTVRNKKRLTFDR